MLQIKIFRDDAREIKDQFFPFLEEICQLRMRDAELIKDKATKLVWRMMLCLAIQVKVKFEKKLLTGSDRFTLKMTVAEGICFHQLLMIFPIDQSMVYEIKLRQQVMDYLSGQLGL